MKPELKKLLVLNLPYLLFVYLFAKCGQAYRLAAGVDASAKLLHRLTCAWALPGRWLSGSSCTAKARTPRNTARVKNTALPDGVHNFKCK